MLECAQPPPITTHNIIHTHTQTHTHPGRPQTTLDAKYNKHYNTAQQQEAGQAEQPEPVIGSLEKLERVQGESFQSKLRAACCDLSTWLNCSACPRFRVQVPRYRSVPSRSPCCRLSRFVSGICHSVSQSVGRSFSYASQNCLQLGIPYSYSHSHSYSSYSYLCF